MARKPDNVEWLGLTPDQGKLLDRLDFYGNNGWARNSQSEALMPSLLAEVEALGMTLDQVKEAMRSIGYDDRTVRQLDRWESKRTTGKFGH